LAPFIRAPTGTLQTISGTNLAKDSVAAKAPYPTQLGGVKLIVGGKPAPLVSVSPTTLVFQVPWDLPPDLFSEVVVQIDHFADTDSIFETGLEIALTPAAFYTRYDPPHYPEILTAAHEDFSALISNDHPARPGEVIHAYGSGLGSVNLAPEPGAPAPAQPLAALAAPLTCTSLDGTTVNVLFAGLAPGMFGVYQVDLQIPKTFSSPITCQVGSATITASVPFAR
jgi:uncharacterized protein (TIGR03437 family)